MKTYLITGSTGFIGKKLLEKLAPQATKIFLLLRPGSEKKISPEIFEKYPQVETIPGNLLNMELGETISQMNVMIRETDAIIHLAGLYDLDANHRDCYPINVLGVQNILSFAKKCERLKEIHHISTYAVDGAQKAHGVIKEDSLDPHTSYYDAYTQTKAQGEFLMKKGCDELGIKLRIYRPGVVIAPLSEPSDFKEDGPYLFFNAVSKIPQTIKSKLSLVPLWIPFPYDKMASIPATPVDTLCDWLFEMITNPTQHKIRSYHLLPKKTILVDQLLRAIFKEMNVSNYQMISIPKIGVTDKVLTTLGLPPSFNYHMYNCKNYSVENRVQDFPELEEPTPSQVLSCLMEGGKEALV